MGKEIRVGVDARHVRAFSEATQNTPKIDFRSFSPHLALRCRLSDELIQGAVAKVSAVVNGGPLDIRINGGEIEGVAVTKEGLESVVEVFCPGRGGEITASMLAKGTVLVLNRS